MISLVLLLSAAPAASPAPRTLRLDYLHTGSASEESFSFDGLVLEGPWPGPPDRLVDDTNLGKYFYEVRDLKANRVLYSRGFASVYGEWETTGEAKERRRGFSESVRFPEPKEPAQVVIRKRGPRNAFVEAWSVVVDPADPAILRTGPPAGVKVWSVMKNGEPRDKVDLLLMGDGYTAAEMRAGSRDPRTESTAAPPWAPRTSPSAPSATSSTSRTRRFGMPPP